MSETIIAYTDGGSRGNPGPAAAAYVLSDASGNEIAAKGCYLGKATNNVAEYTGVLRALEKAIELGAESVAFFCDSELLVKQMNGEYRVKSDKIKPIYEQVVALKKKCKNVTFKHVYRENNTKADSLVNEALDLRQDVERKSKAIKKQKPIRIAVLISGGGTTLLNLLDCIREGSLNATIPLVISSLSKVKGVPRAKDAGCNVQIIRKKDYADIDSFSDAIAAACDKEKIDLIVQAGWLCLWKIPKQYENRVMNIHPALLPSFGGQGMWGHHVHEAVLAHGCKVSGCTVHFCTNEYDKGPIIVQRCCPVEEGDTPDTLAARVFEQECIAYPQAVRLFAQGSIAVEGRCVKISK